VKKTLYLFCCKSKINKEHCPLAVTVNRVKVSTFKSFPSFNWTNPLTLGPHFYSSHTLISCLSISSTTLPLTPSLTPLTPPRPLQHHSAASLSPLSCSPFQAPSPLWCCGSLNPLSSPIGWLTAPPENSWLPFYGIGFPSKPMATNWWTTLTLNDSKITLIPNGP